MFFYRLSWLSFMFGKFGLETKSFAFVKDYIVESEGPNQCNFCAVLLIRLALRSTILLKVGQHAAVVSSGIVMGRLQVWMLFKLIA